MAKYGLLIDYEYCTGCHSCEIACKEEHDFPVGKWGIHVLEDGPWQKCDENDEGKNFNWNFIATPTDLCDGCAKRVAKGKEPTCMHHCLANVITYGPLDELSEQLGKKTKQVLWVIK